MTWWEEHVCVCVVVRTSSLGHEVGSLQFLTECSPILVRMSEYGCMKTWKYVCMHVWNRMHVDT